MIHSGLQRRACAIVGELAKEAGAARVTTIELHYAIERLQRATERDGWPQDAHELRDMVLTITSAIVGIVEALFNVAGRAQRLAAIADLVEPESGGNSV